MNPSDSFHSGLDLVIEQLTARKRLLQDTPSVSPALLETLLRSQAAALPVETPKLAPQIGPIRQIGSITPINPPVDSILTSGNKEERIAALRAMALPCTRCAHLVASRTQVVFGVGNLDAELMFVGEAPGEEEDLQGEPFVGKAGGLLTKMIQAMGVAREDVYIANVLKCRPNMPPGKTGNRKPLPAEMATCLPYLLEQIEIIRPRVIVGLGATAMEGLLGAEIAGQPMGQLRGRWLEFQKTPLMATYHPAYLLRNQATTEKRKVWEDLLMVMEKLGLPINEKQRGFFTK